MLAVAAVAAAAAAAWTGVLLSQDPTNPTSPSGVGDAASDAPLTTLAGATTPIPSVADAAGASMVALRAVTDHGTVDLVGVAVAEGGQVATTADQLSGLESIDMVGQGGKLRHASVVAIDHRSDIALVSVPDDVPVPRFSDDDRLTNGSADLTLTTASAANGAVTLRCTPGTITGIGAAIASGPAAGMPSITSSALSVSEGSGDLLLNSSGEVLGIYYGGAATATTTTTSALAPTFLPTELVVGVADDLRSSGQVTQGWLGIAGSDAVGQPGADVATVTPGSPAAGHLHSGDVIAELEFDPRALNGGPPGPPLCADPLDVGVTLDPARIKRPGR